MNVYGFTDPDEIESEEIESSVKKIMIQVNPTCVIHHDAKRLRTGKK
jgi:hypothetical protein